MIQSVRTEKIISILIIVLSLIITYLFDVKSNLLINMTKSKVYDKEVIIQETEKLLLISALES